MLSAFWWLPARRGAGRRRRGSALRPLPDERAGVGRVHCCRRWTPQRCPCRALRAQFAVSQNQREAASDQMLEDYDVWAPCSAVESAHCSLSSRRCTAGEAPAARRLGQRLRQTRRQFPRRPLRSSQLAPRALRGRAGPAGRGWRRRSRGPWGQRRQGDCCPCRAPRPFARAFWLCSGRCCCDYTAAWRWLSLPTYNCMHSSMPLVSGLQSHFLALNRCEHPIFSCAASSGSFQQSEQA